MFGEHFQWNEQTMTFVGELGRHMPTGFFIYKAAEPKELLYANQTVVDIFGCVDLEDFKQHTGYTFRGLILPEDYDAVSQSIERQVGGSEEARDHVEYRIVRKDGTLRWVDDYGHYTETEAYGGIHYVFVSDITEQRASMESSLATRQAVIEALSKVYHTVWLINDIEAETFSLYRGDTEGATTHAAPISAALGQLRYSQAKQYYIASTVAPSDQERLQRELALDAIVARLRERSQFIVNYRRAMDDGSERYFRIEFAKVDLPDGKMGIVCGFKDVDDEVRQQQAMQEQLIEQERRRAEQDKLITALASDYRSVYYLELDTSEGICYQSLAGVDDAVQVGEHFSYLTTFSNYAEHYITPEYRADFLAFIQPDAIREGLKERRVISFRYMVSRGGVESYEMVRFAGVRHPEDRDDHIVHAVSACFADVDSETREALAQNHALVEALAAAQDANRAKTTFLSTMSHEIRTPMNAIIGLDNIALADDDISDKTREYLEKIGTSAHHLLSIINDILDMSRIESGRMTISSEEFSFSKLIKQVNTIIGGQCRDKGLAYECHLHGDVADYYIGDDMKLRQVLINILGNAVKFTPEGGSVSFDVEEVARYEGNTTLRFVMRDTGIGMGEDYLPRIFDAFSQEDSSSTSRYGSTGLGMPITKNLIELMNGHIEVESEKGVGTTFTATITLKDSERSAGTEDESEIHPHQMSVLVIDDDPVACEHARLVLGQVGVSCDLAASGAEGLEMVRLRHARREPYNLIVIDWKMPELDGVETARRIREVVGHESAIIILTAYSWEDIADEAREAGVDTFVSKPLFAATVMDEFREAFRKKASQAPAATVDLAGRRVLLAEDMAVNAEIMCMVLAMREMEVDVAENGRVAVEMFAASEPGHYDAVLMDIRMPEMDGLEATRSIRAMDRADARTVPIVALTANAFDEDVQRSMQAGLNAHLSKPVKADALFETLEGLIR